MVAIYYKLCGRVMPIGIGMSCNFLLFCICLSFHFVCGLLWCVLGICLGCLLYLMVGMSVDVVVLR